VTPVREAAASFACFGATCAVLVVGEDAGAAVDRARRRLLDWHARFTRFDAASELSRLNADPRPAVPAAADVQALVRAVRWAAEHTGGLVDATLLGAIEDAGYVADLRHGLPLELALRLAPARRPAGPSPAARWTGLSTEAGAGTVSRPPGVRIDAGGLAKGLFADLLAADLAQSDAFGIDCGGDLRLGGSAGLERPVDVLSPFDGRVLHRVSLAGGGVATSGIGRRSWLAAGRPAHHLLDPATGRPAFTGVVQATALAPSALEAEARAKAALLSGPSGAARWLPDGGVVVRDDGSHVVVDRSRAPA
jgi:thiamine biosynthesis lipoprotein